MKPSHRTATRTLSHKCLSLRWQRNSDHLTSHQGVASWLKSIFLVLQNCIHGGFLWLTWHSSEKWSLEWAASENITGVSAWLIEANSIFSLFARNELRYIRLSIGKPMLGNIPSCCFGYYNSSCRKYWISLITDDDGGINVLRILLPIIIKGTFSLMFNPWCQ